MGETENAHTMALLWAPVTEPGHPAPSPSALDRSELNQSELNRSGLNRSGLNRSELGIDAIVEAATALADERGTAAVPLREVGARLGCTAMALYTYISGKDELLHLMFDRAHSGFGARPPVSVPDWAERLLDLYVARPWMLDLAHARPALGPHQQEVFESLLALLVPTGIARRDVTAIASSTFTLAAAAARTVVDAREAAHGHEVTGDRNAERMDALASAAPDFAARFPYSSALMNEDTPEPPGEAEWPLLERAARSNLRRAIRLLLAGAGCPTTDTGAAAG